MPFVPDHVYLTWHDGVGRSPPGIVSSDAAVSDGRELKSQELRSLVAQLADHCLAYRRPLASRAFLQLATTLPPFLAIFAIMLWSVANGYCLALLLAIPAGGLLVRIFIIQHDCGHGSFFASRSANTWLGRMLSILTMTPFDCWKRAHTLHHATSGNLSRRGTGDITTLTVSEYLALSRWRRLRYRVYRAPLVLIGIGAPLNFMVLQRLPFAGALPWRVVWRSVGLLNVALIATYGSLACALGVGLLATAGLPVLLVGAWIGGWLFYVQHQFEDTAWNRSEAWDMQLAALAGSSYYVLPRVLQWFTGNIGLHHVHHLNSRIPNYRLQSCIDDHAVLGTFNRLSLRESIRCLSLALWDEDKGKLVRFSSIATAA